MPDGRLQRTRDAYGSGLAWRAPHENAAERLRVTAERPWIVEPDGVTRPTTPREAAIWNVIEGESS